MSDREFIKLFSGLLGALAALTVILIILANVVANRTEPQKQPDTHAIADRIRPVGQLAVGEAPSGGGIELIATANAASDDKGKTVFDGTCIACHGSGVAGAPKLGDKAAWKDRIAKGKNTLYQHALKGFQGKTGFMPPKGGNGGLSDADVEAAVDFMVSRVK